MAQLAEFIGNHLALSLAFVAVLFLFLSLVLGEKMQAFASINSNELTQLVNQKNAIVIDTRSADNYKQGHIVNAINIPLADITSGQVSLDRYKNKPVIAYCVSGITSRSACKYLLKSGVENVFNLSGGINAWKSANLPLVTK